MERLHQPMCTFQNSTLLCGWMGVVTWTVTYTGQVRLQGVAKYQASDKQFNAISLERGYNVLRFHQADLPVAEFVLAEAFGHCMDPDGKGRLMYSPHYPKHLHMSASEGYIVVDLELE